MNKLVTQNQKDRFNWYKIIVFTVLTGLTAIFSFNTKGQTPVTITVDEASITHLISSEEEHWYKFQTSVADDYSIRIFNSNRAGDIFIGTSLYESDMTTLITNNSQSFGLYELIKSLSANTWYYVKITTSYSDEPDIIYSTEYDINVVGGQIIVLSPGYPQVNAAIDIAGEADWYKIYSTYEPGGNIGPTSIIQTYGSTDTYMYLYAEDFFWGGTSLIAESDSNGTDNNALIISGLSRRTSNYYVKIKGSNSSVTGPYSIDVKNSYGGNPEVYGLTTTTTNREAMPVFINSALKDLSISSISVYHNGGTGNVLVGIYSDNTGSPSSLLGVSIPTAINSTAGWQTISLTSLVPVTFDQIIWLSFVFENNPGVRYTSGISTSSAKSTDTWTGGMPALFGTSSLSNNKYSIYCTYIPDFTKPEITAFTIPATSSSLIVPIISFTATDNTAVTGFKLTETATTPLAGDAGWSAVAPTSYTFPTEGTKTLYAWAKDAAGNVSAFVSAQVEITLPVSVSLGNTEVYNMISMSTNLRAMPVTFSETGTIVSMTVYHHGGTGNVLMAVYSDQSGKVSSLLGVTNSTVINTTAGWQTVSLSSPVTVTAGQKVWLAWIFQNSTGVRFTTGAPARAVSTTTWTGAMSAAFGTAIYGDYKYSIYCSYTTSAVTDVTKPIVTAFTIPASSTSLVVPVNIFTATDNTGVTGFKLTETPAAPLAGDAGWSAVAPISYTFASEGTKTLYAWAKDEAGNVSEGVSAQVAIAIPVALGNTDVYSMISMSTNLRAMPVTISEAGTIVSMTVYHHGGTGNLLMGVYSDLTGKVSSLLGTTAPTVINTTVGWQTVLLASPVTVTAGQKVWLAWIFQNSTGVRFTTGAPARAVSPATWTGAMSAAFGTATYGDYKYSIYCSYTTGALIDDTKPIITDFTVPAEYNSLIVPINSFTATDNTGVTGFKLTETETAPLAGDAGWSTVTPTSFTFASEGIKTLYAWAKDDAGNVSVSFIARVEIALPETLGNKEVYSMISMSTNLRAMPVTFCETGTILNMTIYHDCGTGDLLMGVYSDQTGMVSSLLGITASTPVSSTAGWQTVSLTSPVTVNAGQTVWLAWIFQKATRVRFTVGAPARAVSPVTWTGDMPATFVTATYGDYRYSIYCSYTISTKSAIIDSFIEPSKEKTEVKVYPNPFSDKLNFEIISVNNAHAVLEIQNLLGQSIIKLLDQQVESGVLNHIEYAPNQIISGIYIYKLTLDGKTSVGKVIYNKK